jgi:hypothetical protein
MSTGRKTTICGIVARDAPTAVIFRRGPSRHTRLLRWDLRDNDIRAGQWLVGRLGPAPCGLSPSGDLLIYEARKGARTFTAISRAPFFTALAFWEYSSPWMGGGFFANDTTVVLGLKFANPRSAGDFPAGFEVTDAWSYFAVDGRPPDTIAEVVAKDPVATQGWLHAGAGVLRKQNPVRLRLALLKAKPRGARQLAHSVVEEAHSAKETAKVHDLAAVDWADWAPDGTLLLGQAGRLYRQEMPRSLTDPLEPPRLIADLTDQSFESIIAPEEARQWPPSAGAPRKLRSR